MLATNMSDATSSEEKLRWAFKMYDQDSSGQIWNCDRIFAFLSFPLGTIDVTEMVEIVGNLYEMEGVAKVSPTYLFVKQNIYFLPSLDLSGLGIPTYRMCSWKVHLN